MRKSQVITLALLVVLLTGCKTIPVAELDRYNKAFGELRQVSENILLAYDQTLRESRAHVDQVQDPVRPPMALLLPNTLEDFSKSTGTADDREIKVRKEALGVVEKYNEALVKLASGESVQEVQSATEGFGNALTKFVETAGGSSFPGAGAVIGLAKTAVAQIEKARLRKQFEAAVKNGAPVVNKILEELKLDTGAHYEAAWYLQNERATLTVAEITEKVGKIGQLYSVHASPDDSFQSMADRAASLNKHLRPLALVLPKDEFPYQFTPAPPAVAAQVGPPAVPARPAPPDFTIVVEVEIESQHNEILSLMTVYRAQVEEVSVLGKALNKYGALLDATRNGLTTLQKALDSPQNLELVGNELITMAFQIKRDIETMRTLATSR